MSLAIYASPFDNSNDSSFETSIEKKKQAHNRTQKKNISSNNYNSEKVNSVLQSIHNNSSSENIDDDLDDFNPPPPPESSGGQKRILTENMQNMKNGPPSLGNQPKPNYDSSSNLDLNNFNANYGDSKSSEDYYRKVMPVFNSSHEDYLNNHNKQYYQPYPQKQTAENSSIDNNVLLQKLNHMIHLLEERQDEKTNNVTEEVVLYSFLGIFIIFVCDSFARVGKYVR